MTLLILKMFYDLSFAELFDLTFDGYTMLCEAMNKMNGEDKQEEEQQSFSGRTGAEVAKKIFRKG